MTSPAEKLARAMAHHRAGRLDEAATAYRDVIVTYPKNSDAHNLLGLVLQAQGKPHDAVKSFDRAIRLAPQAASAHFNRGNVLAALNRGAEARAAYEAALKIRPDYADALLNLGALLHQSGNTTQATDVFRRMSVLFPADTRGHFNLAQSLIDTKEFAEAERLLDELCQRVPRNRDARIARAHLYAKTQRPIAAIAEMKEAIALGNAKAEHWSSLGDWLAQVDDRSTAISAHEQACALAPSRGELFFNLGNAFYADGQLERAIETFTRAIELAPRLIDARVNLGQTLSDAGRFDDAIAVFEDALTLAPNANVAAQNKAAAQNNAALALLAAGDYGRGWEAYRRRHDHDSAALNRRPFAQPMWRGEDLTQAKILLWTDQGLGDEILYASMISDVIHRARHCVVECSDRLVTLFQRSFPQAIVVPKLNPPHPATHDATISYQSSVPDLGGVLRLARASFPVHQGYLRPDDTQVERFRNDYAARARGRPIVGISWKSENAGTGKFKSLPLINWEPILKSVDALWVSLQYGAVHDDVRALKAATGIDVFIDNAVDQSRSLDAFAAQVAAMDLVVSVSNTAVHFAGALNIPVWVLTPRGKGCLWYFRNGTSTPWYPTARLYQQRDAGDWSTPIENVRADLNNWQAHRSAMTTR